MKQNPGNNAALLKSPFVLVLPLIVLAGFLLSLAYAGKSDTQSKAAADKTKYGKYILTEPKPDTRPPEQRSEDAPPVPGMLTQMMLLDGEVIKGAFYTEVSWLWKGAPDKVWVKEHTHNFDEVFGFYGTDPKNPKDLCGEIELVIGGEPHTLTKSCVVFVPRGLKHCPLTIKRVDRPILFFTTGPSDIYKNQK